jgi:hypothetical protein
MRLLAKGAIVQQRLSRFVLAALITAVTSPAAAATSTPAASTPADTGYYTYHYDNARTGWNPTETVLSTAAVASPSFGLKRTLRADGVVYAQPLYVPHLTTRSGVRNVVIIASENDSVYAYDADNGALIWHRSFTNPSAGVTAVTSASVSGCNTVTPTIGISSTPVIDPKTQTLYVVGNVQNNSTMAFNDVLHALRLADGSDASSPVNIRAAITLGDGTSLSFMPQLQLNRPGLALANGRVYIAFGSYCDRVPGAVHGWLFAYDAATLAQRAVFDTTASSGQTYLGSIWESTFAPAVDENGNIFVTTGNGTFDANLGGTSYAESVLRLDADLHVTSYFTPFQDALLTEYDQDLGSTGVMLVPHASTPGRYVAISGEKDGLVYLLDRTNLGGFKANGNRVFQTLPLEQTTNALYGGPAYYNGIVYWGATATPMYEFALGTSGSPHLSVLAKTANAFPGEGGEIPAVSSNGTKPGSAVVWATTRVSNGQTFALYAYDALDVSKTLFAGSVGTWLSMGDAFLTPTVAGGHVFVPGAGTGVAEFGLR